MTITDSATVTENDREVRAVLDRLYEAWAAGDADAFVADYTEDATSILPGMYGVGREAIRDRMAGVFAGPLKGTTVHDEVLSVRFLDDAAAVVVSRSTVLMPGQELSSVPDDRWILATWALTRREGRWLVAAYHNCESA